MSEAFKKNFGKLFVKDCFTFAHLQNFADIYYVDTVSTQFMFSNNTSLKLQIYSECFNKYRYILIPYNINFSHWTLIVLSVPNHLIYFFDPGHTNAQSKIFKMVKKFFLLYNNFNNSDNQIDVDEWKMAPNCKNPKQLDSVNCGVFVTFFINTIGESGIHDLFLNHKNFDPENHRIFLQNYLLEKSSDIRKYCPCCGLYNVSKYINCNQCHRWYHFYNCSDIPKTISFDAASHPSFLFNCLFCRT